MALLPKAVALPTTMLPDSHRTQAVKALSANCCSRCLKQFKTRSALLRHLEGKLTTCGVAIAEGGIDVPRSALIDLAHKRTYDGSRRCSGFAAVTRAVQQHRLLGQAADARSLHLSTASTAHALLHFAHGLLMQASSAAASYPCTKLVADAMGALEQHIWDVQLNPAALQSQSGAAAHSDHANCSNTAPSNVQRGPDVPRYPACPVQRLSDGIQTDADRQFMVLMALALAGRAAVGIVDESRLQAWLAAQPQGQEASDIAEQLMVMLRKCCTCLQPSDVLAAAAQRMLACARCIKYDPASGTVDVYSAGDDGRATWKAVSSVDAADQQRWHSVLDSCVWQALQCMIDELTKAWQSGLQRLDALKGVGLEEYVETYMDCWDVSGMNEAQRSQIRPSMAAAIKGARPLP
jgi:hypothetical protein